MKDKYVNRDNFSQIIRHKLEHYSLPVEAGSWDELEKRLNAQPGRKTALWPWISGVSAAASIALAVIFLYIKEKESDHGTTNLSYHAEKIKESVPKEEILSHPPLPSVQTQPAQQKNRQKISVPEISAFRQRDVISSEEPVQGDTELSLPEEIVILETQPANPDSRQPVLLIREFIDPWKSKSKTKSITLRVSTGGRLRTENNTLLATANTSSVGLRSSDISKNSSPLLSDNLLSSNEFNRIAHQAPLSVGLSLRRALTNRLSIESGLTYTYLYSTFETKVPQQVNANLSHHYLGIPVNLAVNMYSNSHSRWNIYISAGGMVEKGLLSHYVQNKNTYSGMNNVIETISSNERIEGLQWSVQTAIGLSYRFNRDYSVFLEPKISYYLNNHQPFNVRTEYPLVPGINFGLTHTW